MYVWLLGGLLLFCSLICFFFFLNSCTINAPVFGKKNKHFKWAEKYKKWLIREEKKSPSCLSVKAHTGYTNLRLCRRIRISQCKQTRTAEQGRAPTYTKQRNTDSATDSGTFLSALSEQQRKTQHKRPHSQRDDVKEITVSCISHCVSRHSW